MDCPRCQARLQRSRDEEAAGDCLNCGPIYIPTVSDPQAELRSEILQSTSGKRLRVRGPKTPTRFTRTQQSGSRVAGDGCDESPSCLTCPLPECKYVDQETQHQERTEPVNPENPDRAIAAEPMRLLSTEALGQQCLSSLRALAKLHESVTARLEQIRDEARKLVRIAELTETSVPPELLAIAGKKPSGTAAHATVPCPDCGKACTSRAGIAIHQARAHNLSGAE